MKTNMLIFILIIIVTCFSCSSNKKIVVEQIDSNYPIILVKGKNVNKISKGDFTHLQEIDDNSELGELNRHILKMSEDIQRLLQEQKERETESGRLEVRVLQAQNKPALFI